MLEIVRERSHTAFEAFLLFFQALFCACKSFGSSQCLALLGLSRRSSCFEIADFTSELGLASLSLLGVLRNPASTLLSAQAFLFKRSFEGSLFAGHFLCKFAFETSSFGSSLRFGHLDLRLSLLEFTRHILKCGLSLAQLCHIGFVLTIELRYLLLAFALESG